MALENMKLTEEEKRFLVTAVTVVEMFQDDIISKEILADTLIKKYVDLDMAQIRGRKRLGHSNSSDKTIDLLEKNEKEGVKNNG